MTRHFLKYGVALALISGAAGAFAGDSANLPDQRERPNQPLSRQHQVELSAFSDAAPCYSGAFSVSSPDSKGFRCVSKQQ
jgi:hypothetical protein